MHLTSGGSLPDDGFVVCQLQALCRVGIDRQHGWHENPWCPVPATDRPSPLHFRMLGGMAIGRVLRQSFCLALFLF